MAVFHQHPHICFLFFPVYLTVGQMQPDEIWFYFFFISLLLAVLHQFRPFENFFLNSSLCTRFLILHTKYKQEMSYMFYQSRLREYGSADRSKHWFSLWVLWWGGYTILKMHRSVLSRQSFSYHTTQNTNKILQIF